VLMGIATEMVHDEGIAEVVAFIRAIGAAP
jgi:hypothetical protein